MDIFEIEGADGQVYEIEAPDQNSAITAFQGSGLGAAPETPAPAAAPAGFTHVGQFGDGDVFERENGQLAFKSPGRSTIDQDEIAEIMAGASAPEGVGTGEGLARAGFQGTTLGFGDEIVAAGAAALDPLVNNTPGTFSERFDARLNQERDKKDEFRKTNPKSAIAAELAGGLTTGLGAGGAGLTLLRGGQTLPAAIGAGAVEGSIYGAIAGAGTNDGNLQDRAKGAIAGGATGAIAGGLLPPVIAAGKAAFKPVGDILGTMFGSADRQAMARVVNTMRESGKSTDEILEELKGLGDEGMLLDVLGAPGESLARGTANVDPTARGALTSAVEKRTAGQPDRLTSKLLEASGLDNARTVDELVEALRQSNAPSINRAYDAAREAGFDIPNTPFKELNNAPLIQQALKAAEKNVKNRAVIEGQQAGSKLAVFDDAKKFLDDKASKAFRSGQNNAGGTASALARQLRETVDNNVPEYAGARQLAQAGARSREAIELGAEGAKNNIPLDFSRRTVQVAPQDAQHLAQGFASGKINQIQNSRATPGVADRLFGSPAQQDALRASLGQRAAPVQQQLANEQVFANTARAVQGNSTTAQQTIDAARQSGITGMLRQGGGAIREALTRGQEQKVAPAVAQLLLAKGVPQRIINMANTDPQIEQALMRLVASETGEIGGAIATGQ